MRRKIKFDPKHCLIEMRKDAAGAFYPFCWSSNGLVGWFDGKDHSDEYTGKVWITTEDSYTCRIHEDVFTPHWSPGPSFMGDTFRHVADGIADSAARATDEMMMGAQDFEESLQGVRDILDDVDPELINEAAAAIRKLADDDDQTQD